MRRLAIDQLHVLELSAGEKFSDTDFESFLGLVRRLKSQERAGHVASLLRVEVRYLEKLEALMYRRAKNVKKGTDEFEKFTKEKDSIESLLRKSDGEAVRQKISSRLAFYQFLTNLIEAPTEKR